MENIQFLFFFVQVARSIDCHGQEGVALCYGTCSLFFSGRFRSNIGIVQSSSHNFYYQAEPVTPCSWITVRAKGKVANLQTACVDECGLPRTQSDRLQLIGKKKICTTG